ncbi:MAG: zinc-binding dehydrogenase [Firmicutes bacterium]|nr:zinc-binding dehydrogenase [Bacillota bacterium]
MKTRQAVLVEPRKMAVETTEVGLPEGFVLVKVERSYLCGSELHYFRGRYPSYVTLPKKLGHEGGGTIVDVGPGVKGYKPGDRVIVYADVLITPSGATPLFADYSSAPVECLQRIPDGIPTHIGALAEPLACAVHAGYHTGTRLGDTVAVFGVGFAGQVIAQIARASGAKKVFIVDVDDTKLALAKKLGADMAVNGLKKDPVKAIMDATNGAGVDIAVDSVGMTRIIDQATAVLRKSGRLVLYGWITGRGEIDWNVWHVKALEPVVTKIGGYPEKKPWAARGFSLYESGQLSLDPLITAVYPVEQIQAAFDRYDTDPSQVKIGIE